MRNAHADKNRSAFCAKEKLTDKVVIDSILNGVIDDVLMNDIILKLYKNHFVLNGQIFLCLKSKVS